MRKIIITSVLNLIGLLVFGQYYTYDRCSVEFRNHPNSEGQLIYENDSVKFEFEPLYSRWKVKIENKTKNICSVNWEGGIFDVDNKSGRIIFGDDSILNKDKEKIPSKIMPGSLIQKDLFPDVRMHSGSVFPIYYKQSIKKGKSSFVKLIIPVDFKDGEKIFEFDFEIFHQKNK